MKKITSYPLLLGTLVGLLLLGAVMIIVIWFPWIAEYHDSHKRVGQAVLFTAVYFALYGYGLRGWLRQSVFWLSICILFLLHVSAVFFYSTRVQPILVWQWPILGLLEYYGLTFFLDWTSGRAGVSDDKS